MRPGRHGVRAAGSRGESGWLGHWPACAWRAHVHARPAPGSLCTDPRRRFGEVDECSKPAGKPYAFLYFADAATAAAAMAAVHGSVVGLAQLARRLLGCAATAACCCAGPGMSAASPGRQAPCSRAPHGRAGVSHPLPPPPLRPLCSAVLCCAPGA